jgi:hypothetical protein
MQARGVFRKYGFFWVTLGFFLLSFVGHWIFAWLDYAHEQREHGEPLEISGYVVTTMRDMLENWQSEFLQLIWQVAGLALLLHIGSPQSKEGDERKEEKLDWIMRRLDDQGAEATLRALDQKFPKK